MANDVAKKIQKRWVIAVALAVVLLGIAITFRFAAQPQLDHHPLMGSAAPDIEFVSESGERQSIRKLEGNAILLNFWAVWCGPCLEEMPSLAALERHYASQGLNVLAIDIEGEGESVRETLGGMELPRNLIVSFNKAQLRPYDVRAIPLSILIDRKGIVRRVYTGPREWMEVETLREIEEALSKNGS